MPFFHLMMLDALALGLLLTMSELLYLVFATMGFTARIQWYHHIHTLIMGYAFMLFIRFVTYEEWLMRSPCCCLNRSRLRSRSIINEVSSSHPTRHQYTRLCSQNSEVVISIGLIPISALGAVTGILITIAALFSVGTIVLIEIVTIIIVLIFFLLPHYTLIHWPLTYISFLSLASLTSSCLSASLEYYFALLYTPAAASPYVYSNHMLSPGPPKIPPGELVNGEFLFNAILSLEYESITIH